MKICIVALFLVAIGAFRAGSQTTVVADSSVSQFDVVGMNACIESALAEGEQWPQSPMAATYHLFGLGPNKCAKVPVDSTVAGPPDDEIVSVAFRPTLDFQSQETGWFKAIYRRLFDGMWRLSTVESLVDRSALLSSEPSQVGAKPNSNDSDRPSVFPNPWSPGSGPPRFKDFDWQKLGPVDFLEFLKGKSSPYEVISFQTRYWIDQGDIVQLTNFLESKEPCACVVQMGASSTCTEMSTVGKEAARLIEGFRKGSYPPSKR